VKKFLIGIVAVFFVVVMAGIVKFNILAGMDGYDVDGNRIENCENYRYSNCPKSCVSICVPSVCENGLCTS